MEAKIFAEFMILLRIFSDEVRIELD
jgi:hypothetical protein